MHDRRKKKYCLSTSATHFVMERGESLLPSHVQNKAILCPIFSVSPFSENGYSDSEPDQLTTLTKVHRMYEGNTLRSASAQFPPF